MPKSSTHTLGLLFGDQLDPSYPHAMGLEQGRDVILMMEVAQASQEPRSSRVRTVTFLSAMRHYAADLRKHGWDVEYISRAGFFFDLWIMLKTVPALLGDKLNVR